MQVGVAGSGSKALTGGGAHTLVSVYGFRVCATCKAYASEVNGKHRSLGKKCEPATGNALRLRNLKIDNIMKGLDPKTGERLAAV